MVTLLPAVSTIFCNIIIYRTLDNLRTIKRISFIHSFFLNDKISSGLIIQRICFIIKENLRSRRTNTKNEKYVAGFDVDYVAMLIMISASSLW